MRSLTAGLRVCTLLRHTDWQVASQAARALCLPVTYRVIEQVSKELKGQVGDKHDWHNAKHRKDRESCLDHLMDLHDKFYDPTNQLQSYTVVQHGSLTCWTFVGPTEVPVGPTGM